MATLCAMSIAFAIDTCYHAAMTQPTPTAPLPHPPPPPLPSPPPDQYERYQADHALYMARIAQAADHALLQRRNRQMVTAS